MEPAEPVVVAARRTPVGTAGHALRAFTPADLAAPVLRALLDDLATAPDQVAAVVLGCCTGPGGNVARVAALQAGFGDAVPGLSLDQQCASGLAAVNLAAALVRAGVAGIHLAGGTESGSLAPDRRAAFVPAGRDDPDMGVAAETVAREAGVGRRRQDDYAARSHGLAIAAQAAGRLDAELVPIGGLTQDQRPRSGLTADRLGRLPPAFVPDGTVTAGNSCGVGDGAAAVAVVPGAWRASRDLPGLRVVDWEVAGVDPGRLGLGPVPAVTRLLERNGLAVTDVGAWEITEAFAGQVLACLDGLKIDEDLVCTDGGAIATGHPWGASGATLVVRLFGRMVRSDGPSLGVAMCGVAGGLGVATLLERVA